MSEKTSQAPSPVLHSLGMTTLTLLKANACYDSLVAAKRKQNWWVRESESSPDSHTHDLGGEGNNLSLSKPLSLTLKWLDRRCSSVFSSHGAYYLTWISFGCLISFSRDTAAEVGPSRGQTLQEPVLPAFWIDSFRNDYLFSCPPLPCGGVSITRVSVIRSDTGLTNKASAQFCWMTHSLEALFVVSVEGP